MTIFTNRKTMIEVAREMSTWNPTGSHVSWWRDVLQKLEACDGEVVKIENGEVTAVSEDDIP